jgi:PPOX class probable F420-dependent enzyme
VDVPAPTLDALLQRWPVARLATVSPIGHPHLLPVVFAPVEGCVCSPVDGKRKTAGRLARGRLARGRLARVRNVEAHGRASLLLDAYADDWAQLWWVRLDGPAWVECDDAELLTAAAAALRAKYPQYQQYDTFSDVPTLLVLRWNRVAAWSQAGDDRPIRRALAALG